MHEPNNQLGLNIAALRSYPCQDKFYVKWNRRRFSTITSGKLIIRIFQ